MLHIRPVQNKDEQEKLCALCAVEYNPDAMAYAAFDDEIFLGVSQFRIRGESGEIYHLRNAIGIDDLEALIIMGRATLNFIDLCDIHSAVIFEREKKIHTILGAKERDGAYIIDLAGYFDSPCKNKKNANKKRD